ncbi:MAG TPA: hypothetical protein VMP03_16865 [Methylomirabilota bacterium]|nr:hypothetical protein [Methylomirabilota bacterium]
MAISNRKPTVETLNKDVAALRADLARIADTLGSLAEQATQSRFKSARSSANGVADDARSILSGADAEVREALERIRAAGRDVIDETRGRIAERRDELHAAVERNPLTVLGLVAVAGIAVGLMARGRRDRD